VKYLFESNLNKILSKTKDIIKSIESNRTENIEDDVPTVFTYQGHYDV
jgi:hypothetical protein